MRCTRLLVVFIWFAFSIVVTAAEAAVTVDGATPEDSNNNGILDVGDVSVQTKKFRSLQAALFALHANLVQDTEIVVTTPILWGHDANVPSNVPRFIEIRKALRISAGAGMRTTITGGNVGVRVTGPITVTLIRISISGAASQGLKGENPGGTTGPTIELKDLEISHNGSSGVTLYNGTTAVLDDGVKIHDNGGFGLFADARCDVTIKKSFIHDNDYSGVHVNNRGKLVMEDTEAFKNDGRGVSLARNTKATVVGSKIYENKEGGVSINACPADVEFRGNEITRNTSDHSGAGMSIWGGSNVRIVANTIAGNVAKGAGGGIVILDSTAVIGGPQPSDSNAIVGNTTLEGFGGGIACQSSTSLLIQRNQILQNRAPHDVITRPGEGGGIGLYSCPATIKGNKIQENTAQMFGAGIAARRGSSAVIGGDDPIDKNEIRKNTVADGNGGGIGADSSDVHVFNNQIEENTAETGGGIHVGNGSSRIGKAGAPTNTIYLNVATEQNPQGTPGTMGIGAGINLLDADGTEIVNTVVVKNNGTGIHLNSTHRASIHDSWVGVTDAGQPGPNQGHGLSLIGSNDAKIGPKNVIAHNAGSGVSVGSVSNRNRITENSITENRDLGIYLWGFGNNDIAAPTGWIERSNLIRGRSSTPGGRIELFRDSDKEGKEFLDATTAGAGGVFAFSGSFGRGRDLTLTETDANGNTSEFIPLIRLDLAVDSDNDARTDPPSASDAEDAVEMTAPGKVVFVNDDDDDGDGRPDHLNSRIDGAGDLRTDLAWLRIGELPDTLTDGKLVLSVDDRMRIRIFDAGGTPRIGPAAPSAASYTIPWPEVIGHAADYRIEGYLSGRVTVRLTLYDRNGVEMVRDEALVSVWKVDLDMDANRNGSISAGAEDDDGEDSWSWGRTGKGAVFICNNDDDDGAGGLDHTNDVVDGANDVPDLASVVIRRPGPGPLPAGWSIRVHATEPSRIRMFDDRSPTGSHFPLAGGVGALTNAHLSRLFTADVTFGLESREFPGHAWDGRVDVRLDVSDALGTVAEDRVAARAAPFLFSDNRHRARKLYVSGRDAPFAARVRSTVGIPRTAVLSTPDVWVQDEFEIGYTKSPESGNRVVADLPRDRLLNGHLRLHGYVGQDLGNFDAPGSPLRMGDYGGNLEVTPPVTVGANVWPSGRIVTGMVGGDYNEQSATLRQFLDAQEAQAPVIEIDVGWLEVGHVDEVLAIAPAPGPHRFAVVVADTVRARSLLGGVAAHEPMFYESGPVDFGTITSATVSTLEDTSKAHTPNRWRFGALRIYGCRASGPPGPVGRDRVRRIVANGPTSFTVDPPWSTPPPVGCSYVVVQKSKEWPVPFGGGLLPALVTAGELRTNTDAFGFGNTSDLLLKNDAIQTKLDSYVATMRTALQPQNVRILRIPSLYFADWAGAGTIADESGGALIPGAANFQIFGTTALVPKPFGPKNAAGRDVFEEAITAELRRIGLSAVFIDDWDTYHVSSGEVHCGTNVEHDVPATERWWEKQP